MTPLKKKVVTRFAPSPTGEPHIGSLRTALYNWLYARQNRGNFLLRIEDTDRQRYQEESDIKIFEMLDWVGLNYDDKPIYQSIRKDIYREHALKLVKNGYAYYCFCSKERLERLRQRQQGRGEAPRYDRLCRQLGKEEIKNKLLKNLSHTIRLKMPTSGVTKLRDIIRGSVSFPNKEQEDPIILKSDGFPTYHLAVVVDDNEFKVTHVIRGEEWLSSTPKHLQLYQYFNWPLPQFAHLPLILAPDRSKLSKRHGTVSVLQFRNQGYLPSALLNFVLLLGWHPKKGSEKEIFSLSEMIKEFKLDQVQKSAAIFDKNKLDWLNSVYLRQLSIPELTKLALPFLEAEWFNLEKLKINLELLVNLEKDRIKKLAELPQKLKFILADKLDYAGELLIWKKSDKGTTLERLKWLKDLLTKIPKDKWQQDKLEKFIKKAIEENSKGVGETLWPMRVALTGQRHSPSPFEVAAVLGPEKTLKRLAVAIDKLQNYK